MDHTCSECSNLIRRASAGRKKITCSARCRSSRRRRLSPDACREYHRRYSQRWAEENRERVRQQSLASYYRRKAQGFYFQREITSVNVEFWKSEALWAEGTKDAQICIETASSIPQSCCFLSSALEDFVARWLDPDY